MTRFTAGNTTRTRAVGSNESITKYQNVTSEHILPLISFSSFESTIEQILNNFILPLSDVSAKPD